MTGLGFWLGCGVLGCNSSDTVTAVGPGDAGGGGHGGSAPTASSGSPNGGAGSITAGDSGAGPVRGAAGSALVAGTSGSGAGGLGGYAGGSADAGSAGSAGRAASLVGSGTISYERWEGVKGEAVSLVPTNEPPDVTLSLGLFQMPNDVGQDLGARIRGYLTAPLSGDYWFWISCDDNGELSLSRDATPANKQRIAYVSGSPAWTDYVEWDKFTTQKSAPITLVAGTRYYVEALLKEDIAEDHLAVGWTKPGDVSQDSTQPFEIIPGKQLSPIE